MCTHQPINGTRAPIGRGLNVVQSVVSTSSINSRETLENRVMVNEEKYMYQTHRIIRRFEIYTKSIWRFCEQDVAIFLKISNISYHRDILSSISTILFLSFNHFFYNKFCCSLDLQLDLQPRRETWMVLERKFSYKISDILATFSGVYHWRGVKRATYPLPFTISYFLS